MMNTRFKSQIGRNVQVYVDDMIVKSKSKEDHVNDLRETFENVRRHSMRLNPAKCSFRLTSGKFLGFLVFQRGIEADPTQIRAILDMPSPTTVKQIQKLTGCIAALRRFILQASKKCSPFFQTIKNASKIQKISWNEDCEKFFQP